MWSKIGPAEKQRKINEMKTLGDFFGEIKSNAAASTKNRPASIIFMASIWLPKKSAAIQLWRHVTVCWCCTSYVIACLQGCQIFLLTYSIPKWEKETK
jgi:hypothetical protein